MDEKHSWDKVNSWSEELDLLNSIIVKTNLVETTKWGGTVYTFEGKNVLGIGGLKTTLRFGFSMVCFSKMKKRYW